MKKQGGPPSRWLEAEKLRRQGLALDAIGERFGGVSRQTVYGWLRRLERRRRQDADPAFPGLRDDRLREALADCGIADRGAAREAMMEGRLPRRPELDTRDLRRLAKYLGLPVPSRPRGLRTSVATLRDRVRRMMACAGAEAEACRERFAIPGERYHAGREEAFSQVLEILR